MDFWPSSLSVWPIYLIKANTNVIKANNNNNNNNNNKLLRTFLCHKIDKIINGTDA